MSALKKDRSGRPSLESRIAYNLANLTCLLECPFALVGIRERNVPVGAPGGNEWLASLVNNLATIILLLDQGANDDLDACEKSSGNRLFLSLTFFEWSLDPELDAGVTELDDDLGGGGFDLLEGWVTDDLAHLAGLVSEGPFAFSAIGEGDICVGAALYDDGFAGVIENLAAVVLVLYILAHTELDEAEGSGLGGMLRDSAGSRESVLCR